jgi:methenyltetrahydrofolate cyclohydrolase
MDASTDGRLEGVRMTLAEMRIGELLEQVGAKQPTPGGGGVAALTGAMAAALAQMVVAYSLGKKSLAAHQGELEAALGYLSRAQSLLLGLAEEDAEAYGLVNELQKLPEDDARRQRELAGAVEAAIQVPLSAIATCDDLLRRCESLRPKTNPYLHSDLAIAAGLAEASARGLVWMVRVNAAMLPDGESRRKFVEQAEAMAADCRGRREGLERAIGHR